MPETNRERLIFLLMMSTAMTIGMESYNLILMHASGNHLFKAVTIDFPLMTITVALTQWFIAGPIALHFASWFLPENPSPFRRILTISTCTVLLMCPLMSLAATILFKGGFQKEMISIWLQTTAFNYPMAAFWQLLVAGPLVRGIFGLILKKKDSSTITEEA